ncbi:hypothetical protein BC938DRAFT_479709 [Jimgerdemannia flammicorona]|uniref:Flavin-nucleotide-binding protein n=1 Tax=Jimgerdemannia flammicorona TaxID=994334 RepID=A0A433QKD2_9FUNG|nr:hypothetical protein BC938DRAFT_479709 [Jimgerdemannia flammicorona]
MATNYTPSTPSSLHFVHRLRDRAAYDAPTIHSILDSGLVAHVGFTLPASINPTNTPSDDQETWPFVIPMAYGRVEDIVYLHGYVSGRMMKALSRAGDDEQAGPPTTITVTHVDSLVLALDPFNNSFNYRSACVFGHARLVSDEEEKMMALKTITDHPFNASAERGSRWEDSKLPTEAEMKTTKVIAVRIKAASAKARRGDVKDDKKDIEDVEGTSGRYWAGVVPVETRFGEARGMEYSKGIEVPGYVKGLNGRSLN